MRLILFLFLPAALLAEPLTLKQAVELALENSPEIRLSAAQQEKAQQSFREARTQFMPNVVVGSGLAGTIGFPLSMEGAAPSLFQFNSSALLFNRPQKHAIEEARLMWQAAGSGAQSRTDEIIWKTAAIYLELDKTRRSLGFARREVESAARLEQVVGAQVQEGREIPLEAAKARLAAARQRQSAADLEAQAGILESALRGLTGIPAGQSIETIETPLPAPPLPAAADALQSAIERALEDNAELKRLRQEVAARQQRVQSERAQRWPQADLIGQYAVLSRANNYDRFFRDFQRQNAQIGMSLRLTVFDGHRISARVGQAQADLMQAQAALAAARNDLALEVRKACQAVRQRETAREVAKMSLDVARESAGVVLARFQEGRVSARELEQAHSEEAANWLAFLDADFALERARLDLLRQTGGLRAALRP